MNPGAEVEGLEPIVAVDGGGDALRAPGSEYNLR
jgi:hypothetical protein